MKNGIISAALIFSGNTDAQRGMLARPEEERRYSQLVDMMAFYNPDFNELKYWTYGCQCLMLGDRPMSDPGFGPPVDALDSVCKQYKDCLKCAREEHGEMCIGEFQAYKYGKRSGEVKCRDRPGTGKFGSCKRKLCECDKKFAEAHVAVAHVYDKEKHMFYSTKGWEPKDECPRVSNGGPYDPQCCGTPTTAAVLYNAASGHKCCSDGTVKNEC